MAILLLAIVDKGHFKLRHRPLTFAAPIRLIFLNNIDKMAIFGLHILKILHENNFWTKKRLFFEGLLNG